MDAFYLSPIRSQLVERRERLLKVEKNLPDSQQFFNLLKQVDAALERIDNGAYGICEVCKGQIETERLLADPLVTVCLDDLNAHQQKALERDLEFAAKIQRNMLPQNNLTVNGWELSYIYNPAGPVSGDFCDLIKLSDNTILFALGDVSGKGVAASLMMSHLHALIHSLLSFGLSLSELVEKANRLFCESTMNTNYATIVFGKASPTGEVEICNAGHNPPFLLSDGSLLPINATGIPIGLFNEMNYTVDNFLMKNGDSLFLYTDGLTEATSDEIEYGEERVRELLLRNGNLPANLMIESFIKDNKNYIGNSLPADDLTLMVVKKK
jgi:sigma-B regulation protein RsbU (phosphoserine phosphatase)